MSKRKKIAVIGVKGLPGYGGAARANDKILPKLANRFDITVYALDTHASDNKYRGLNQHIFRSIGSRKINSLIYYIKAFFHALFRGKYDLIHLNHGVSGIILPFLKIRFRVVTTIRGLNYSQDDKWNEIEYKFLKFAEKISFKFSDYLTTVQKSSVEYIQNRTTKPVVYIPNGVNNYYSEYSNIQKEDVITLSAARLIYLKGVHVFLEALQTIGFRGRVRIIGDLNQVEEYKELILNLSKGLDVEFTGLITNQTKLFKLISASRLFVFPSFTEGMSNMLLEVASLKVPIIASDIVANKDVFDDHELIYFSAGNSEELGIKIKYYWNHPTKCNTYVENAYQKVITEHKWDHIASHYSKIYEKL